MEINIQEIIELEDCSEFAIEKRNKETKRALARYRHGKPKTDPEEKTILIKAMEIYKSQVNEGDAARYNALLYRNFASRPLMEGQIAKILYINKRTVYKLLESGVKDLTKIFYGVGGLELMPNEESPAYIKESLQESITKQLTEELGQEVRKEFCSFFKKYRSNIIGLEESINPERKVAQQRVRETLNRIKEGNATPEEREELMQAMERYKATSANKKQDIAYNILLSFYLTAYPLKVARLSDKYRINQRTVYKYITRGVEDLTEIMCDLKGGE